jgi:hypothetical protein
MPCTPETHPSELQAGLYSAAAPPYAQLWAPVLRPMSEQPISVMPLAGASTMLDLGTGTVVPHPRHLVALQSLAREGRATRAG